ncbi:MAG: YdbL family protein [Sphingomonas bacterium]|nr:YdbL family protein [Sphingomonas bacterium]
MIRTSLWLTLACIGLSQPAAASAQAAASVVLPARAAGLIGERYDGYLGFVTVPGDALRKQVGAVNIKRRALYSDLARRRGVTPQEVGVTAACALLARGAAGEAYQLTDGQWRRRVAGQSAPRPAYCG